MEALKLKIRHPRCMPTQATQGSAGYDLVAYDVSFVEAVTSEMVRTKNQLGIFKVPSVDATTEETTFLELDHIFKLETLYRCLIDTGIDVMYLEPGYEIQIRPRSGLALKFGIVVVNSPGTIDSDYRKTIGVILCNLGSKAFPIKQFDRIAQMVIKKVEHPDIIITNEAEQTERTGGFGSTGV